MIASFISIFNNEINEIQNKIKLKFQRNIFN